MSPQLQEFHQSISQELQAVKDRLRMLVEHWPTDGAHKEAALRAVLRRHIGDSMIVGRGFIVDQQQASRQIDVMVIDRSCPTLFKDGDLYIVTPDAVRAVIEVKTQLDRPQAIREAIAQLREQVSPFSSAQNANQMWAGLFVFTDEEAGNLEENTLVALAQGEAWAKCPVNAISAGESTFFRWWPKSCGRSKQPDAAVSLWRSYGLDRLAPSYFIGNLLAHLSKSSVSSHAKVWFPIDDPRGKEARARREIRPGQLVPGAVEN